MPVPPKTAGGGSPFPGTTSACLRVTSPASSAGHSSPGTHRAGAERGLLPDQLWVAKEPCRPYRLQTLCAGRTHAKTCQPLSAARHGEGVPCSVEDEGVPQPSLALG